MAQRPLAPGHDAPLVAVEPREGRQRPNDGVSLTVGMVRKICRCGLINATARYGYAAVRPPLRGNLRELAIDLPEPPWPVVMVTASKRPLNPVVQRFIETAREVAKSFIDRARGPSTH